MRYTFLLDENIIYHAIRRVDRHDIADDTALLLVKTIVEVCHSLVIHISILDKYIKILHKLKREVVESRIAAGRSQVSRKAKSEPSPRLEPGALLNQLLQRSDKRNLQYEALPTIPAGCGIPTEDEYIVRAALISHSLFVTADEPLYSALKNHPELGIEVLWPHEALERARERPE